MRDAAAAAKRALRRVLGPVMIGRGKSAARTLRTALSTGAARKARMAQAAWDRGDADLARTIWKRLEDAEPHSPIWPQKLSMVAGAAADHEAAEKILLAARARGASDDELDQSLIHFGRWRRLSNTAIDEALGIVAAPDASALKVFYAAVYLSSENLLEPARQGLRRLTGNRRLGHSARGQLAALDMLERMDPKARPTIPGWLSPARNAVIVREPASVTAVVAFAPPGGLFGVTVNALHAMLAPAGVNAIYLYDSRQLFHLGGSDRFGPGYGAMISGVRALLSDMGIRKVITVGASATGYTAIRAGLDLEAQGIVAFSPVTSMTVADMEIDGRMPHMKLRLLQHVPDLMKDLRPDVERRTHCARIELYYSGANMQDRTHAERLAHAPGVVLKKVPALESHDCVSELVVRGTTNILKAFTECET